MRPANDSLLLILVLALCAAMALAALSGRPGTQSQWPPARWDPWGSAIAEDVAHDSW